jgi:multidrug efflux pump subunit AcrB
MIGTLQEALPTAVAAADSAASADTAPSPELVRFNGRRALALEVVKKSSANTLDLVHRVDAVIGEISRSLPGIEIVQASTQANYIEEANHATLEAIAIAVALSVIVIYPFLWDWKATLISALAIPTSLFGTFIVMAICGFSLETITLLAIALVVGIIVDDAIVDVENISRHLDLGEPPREAAIAATDEVSLTVTAATLTIAAVFIPVGLMGGVVGQFFRPFGLTVSAAVLISLLVARTLSPLLSMYWLRASPSQPEGQSRFSFLGGYTGLLKWALRHRVLVVALTLSSLLLGIGLVSVVNKGFIPRLDRGEFLIHFTAATTTPSSPEANAIDQPRDQPLSMARIMAAQLLQTQKQAERIEERVRREPEVKDILMTVGNQWGQADRGELLIRLQPHRQRSTLEHQTEIRNRLAGLRGLDVRVEDIPFVETGSEQPIQIKLLGSDLPSLDRAAIALKHRLSTLPGLVDISTSAPPSGDPENLVIEHVNGRRIRYVRANLLPGTSVDHAVSRISEATAGVLPGGVTIDFGGDSERIREILSSFLFTITLGIVCILGVLVFLYRTWSDPLIIMFSLPLSFCGAMLALLLTRQEFGMISVIGIIFLMGLTNKNAIIMVDYVNQLRSSGLEPTEAILTGATVRLRPILMTTAATILGMLPVALGLGAGSELRAPMAIAILGGLVASTLLSLFVIPVMVSLLEGFKRKISIASTPSR